MVHSCAHEDCNVLTMGRFCLEHEPKRGRVHRPTLTRVATACALLAAGVLGAAVRGQLGR